MSNTDASIEEPVLVYDRISANRHTTGLLMAGFIILIGGIVWLILFLWGLSASVLPGVLRFVGLILIAYAIIASTRIVLSIAGAHEVTKKEEWEFVRRVENLSIGAGLPMPRTWVLEDSAPNAFATGTNPESSHIVVTRGLLEKLEPIELESVLAHELSHIGNYDTRVMTVVTVLVGAIALISDFALRATFWGAGKRPSNRGRNSGAAIVIVLVIMLVVAILAPIVVQVMRFSVSRRREYLADASGALLCRNPDALARALEKIAEDPEPLEAANKATAHLYIYNPLREHKSFFNGLFNTHPPTEERVRLLRAM